MSAKLLLIATLIAAGCGRAQEPARNRAVARIADSFLARHAAGVTADSAQSAEKWNYEQGFMLRALTAAWHATGEKKYFDFVVASLDRYVDEAGAIRTYRKSDYNLDNIGPGRALLAAYEETRQKKYRIAADTLRAQLREQPRTAEGGFWHKKIYPEQMWLDGLFMAEPFYAEYAAEFKEGQDFDDIALQFTLMARHAADSATGLLAHGWDASKSEAWADRTTGRSPAMWGRAMGWYAMGLVDVLDEFPANHRDRMALVKIFANLSEALLKVRDPQTHLWRQVVDQGTRTGNYTESSASAMFIYCFAKGVRMGYLDGKFLAAARESFDALMKTAVTTDPAGNIDLHGTCGATGLGGKPYRDGSFAYYTAIEQRTNDLRGVAALLLSATEIERTSTMTVKEEE